MVAVPTRDLRASHVTARILVGILFAVSAASAGKADPVSRDLAEVRRAARKGDWAALEYLRDSVARGGPAESTPVLRAIALAELRGGRWVEARETLASLPPSNRSEPLDDLYDALRGAARNEYYESVPSLSRYLDADTSQKEKDQALVWCALVRPQVPGPPPQRPHDDEGGMAVEPLSFDEKHEVELPSADRKVQPEYPKDARRRGIQGRVTLQVVVLSSGYVVWPAVLASKHPEFNESALRAVSLWRYRPATENGKPVSIYFTILFTWKLDG